MKITNQQLKRIIKEELEAILIEEGIMDSVKDGFEKLKLALGIKKPNVPLSDLTDEEKQMIQKAKNKEKKDLDKVKKGKTIGKDSDGKPLSIKDYK